LAVKKTGAFIKMFFNSEDFQKRYKDWVIKSYPQIDATVSEKRKEEIRANRLKGVQGLNAKDMGPVVDIQIQSGETFASMESMLTSLPPEQRADFKKQIEQGKRTAAFFKKIKPLLKTDMEEFKKQYAEFLANDEIRQSEETLARNNKNNAQEYEKWKDPKKVLITRLNDFLNQSNGVDFAAQTKEVSGRKKFVNAAYEGKNDVWKFCYRIGPTPTNAARAFAQQWLTELK
jgi:FtsZ-binding cell division protein ZapB